MFPSGTREYSLPPAPIPITILNNKNQDNILPLPILYNISLSHSILGEYKNSFSYYDYDFLKILNVFLTRRRMFVISPRRTISSPSSGPSWPRSAWVRIKSSLIQSSSVCNKCGLSSSGAETPPKRRRIVWIWLL